MEKWLNMMESTFYEFVIPFLRKNSNPGDILIHLGDLFDNRTNLPILILNRVEKILREISKILPIHIMVGNHDLWNKGSNEVNSVRLFGYMNDNITVYEKTEQISIGDKKLILMPWVEKRVDMIKEIDNNPGDYLFCHSDLNGCSMHLNSVAHRNADKIDVDNFSKYKNVFSGHIHITQVNKNFRFIGSLFQMDRNDSGDQKGITSLDLDTDEIDFYPNLFSPVFRKFSVKTPEDIEKLDELKDSKDYIDLSISNSLLMSNRKLRRKLETLLEKGKFASVEYIDDIVKVDENGVEIIEESVSEDDKITINLDYEEYIKEYISGQKYENGKFRTGVLSEFDEIVKIYNENFRSKG
jgi:3',5'-cyclic AMP phosphodiesterase CpdA